MHYYKTIFYLMSIVLTHNAGFFSCCSVRLHYIIEYINEHHKLPISVDSSGMFAWYKQTDTDITYVYFTQYDEVAFNHNDVLTNNIDFNWDHQYKNYSTLEYDKICPLVDKYFALSNGINTLITNMENKYKLDYNNICVLFYRGNDKNTETKICGYDEYVEHARAIQKEHPTIRFLIQSDETEFIALMLSLFPNNAFFFKEETRHINRCMGTVDFVFPPANFMYSQYYLAITKIMSKCNIIVCGSGNCSIWIMFYRGHCKNTYQNLNGEWIITK
jgi:hypothetical protein